VRRAGPAPARIGVVVAGFARAWSPSRSSTSVRERGHPPGRSSPRQRAPQFGRHSRARQGDRRDRAQARRSSRAPCARRTLGPARRAASSLSVCPSPHGARARAQVAGARESCLVRRPAGAARVGCHASGAHAQSGSLGNPGRRPISARREDFAPRRAPLPSKLRPADAGSARAYSQELNARIRELRRVVREFERLERAAEALAREGARRVPALRSRVRPS
jgi:hypothetical protein